MLDNLAEAMSVIYQLPFQFWLGMAILLGTLVLVLHTAWQNEEGQRFHEELRDEAVNDSLCHDHSDWRLTWPRVDDEWTGVVNIVCNRCAHTEPVPRAWSLANVFPWV